MPDDIDNDDLKDGLSLEDIGLGGDEAGNNDGGSGPPPSGASADPADSSVQATQQPAVPPAGEPAAPTGDPWMVPPKSWKKELHQHYSSLTPDVQRYIHERESQALQGLMQYKQQADAYNQIFEPYKEIMAQANIQPTALVQNLAANHHVLATGTREQKVAVARQLLQEYNLDPRDIIFGVQADPNEPAPASQPAVPADYDTLKSTVGELQSLIMNERKQAIQKQVDDFAAANKFYSEVEDDIAELLSTGAAQDLQTAYDIAIYRNPAVRQKVLADLTQQTTQTRQQSVEGKRKAAGLNLTSGADTAAPAKGTIEDTLEAIANKHYAH